MLSVLARFCPSALSARSPVSCLYLAETAQMVVTSTGLSAVKLHGVNILIKNKFAWERAEWVYLES